MRLGQYSQSDAAANAVVLGTQVLRCGTVWLLADDTKPERQRMCASAIALRPTDWGQCGPPTFCRPAQERAVVKIRRLCQDQRVCRR